MCSDLAKPLRSSVHCSRQYWRTCTLQPYTRSSLLCSGFLLADTKYGGGRVSPQHPRRRFSVVPLSRVSVKSRDRSHIQLSHSNPLIGHREPSKSTNRYFGSTSSINLRFTGLLHTGPKAESIQSARLCPRVAKTIHEI